VKAFVLRVVFAGVAVIVLLLAAKLILGFVLGLLKMGLAVLALGVVAIVMFQVLKVSRGLKQRKQAKASKKALGAARADSIDSILSGGKRDKVR
jgi:hypothetical protein